MISKFLSFFRDIFIPPERKAVEVDYDIDLIKKWEGLRLDAYQDTGGVWTIGYGHTKTARPGMRITQAEADYLLAQDVKWAVEAVNDLVKVPINRNQKSALVSFTYNLGKSQVARSTLIKKLNNKDYQGASKEFLRWVYDNGRFIPGLKNRRKDEMKRFLS